MLYEINQFYDDGTLRYSVTAIGKKEKYPTVFALDCDHLLGILYDAKKYDNKMKLEPPPSVVNEYAFNAIIEAFEKGWLTVNGPTRITPDSFRTTPQVDYPR